MAEPKEPESSHEHEEISIEVICPTLGSWKDDDVLDRQRNKAGNRMR
jgi:hypothetical protein